MLAWFFTGIWHMLLGFVLLVTFFIGSVIVLAKAIAQAGAHDQKTCDCWDCKDRRARASDRRMMNKPRQVWDKQTTGHWLTTEELTTSLRVVSKTGVVYEITGLVGRDHGVIVNLTVLASGRKSQVFIPKANVGKRLWKRAPDWRQG